MNNKQPFQLVAGHVALDFVNTLDNRYVPEQTVDQLTAYSDLLRFCVQNQILDRNRALTLETSTDAQAAAKALTGARQIRETLSRIFSDVALGNECSPEDLSALNLYLEQALAHRNLEKRDGKFVWQWRDDENNPISPVWPILYAAATLLTSEEAALVRECQSETCRWLFLDKSKNHTRRWCDMKSCGNRAKARAHYRRSKDPAG